MKIIVLGSGITGTTSAWFLKKAGHDVTVIDRQSGAARETSFANGCQISVSHAEPWANPSTPLKVLKMLGKEDAPLLFRLRLNWQQWKWTAQFLRECFPSRVADNIRQIVSMCEYSRQTLQQVRAETNIQYDHLTKGILHFYTDEKEFELSQPAAQLMRELGCPRNTLSTDEVLQLEPSLAHVRSKIVGGDYTETDESGDVYKFTSGLAKKAEEAGVNFMFDTRITRLLNTGAGAASEISGVEIINSEGHYETLTADAFVVAMGSFSPELVRPLGIPLSIYPAKGYSATYQIKNPEATPTISLTDDGHKLVMSRLGNRLRVAGTCEINAYTRELSPARCMMITQRTKELFPDACDYDHPEYWSGLRPATPSNVPYVGKTKYKNLYLNTGHGTLGWTMGCGSGKAIAEIIDGRTPEINFGFTGIPRKLIA